MYIHICSKQYIFSMYICLCAAFVCCLRSCCTGYYCSIPTIHIQESSSKEDTGASQMYCYYHRMYMAVGNAAQAEYVSLLHSACHQLCGLEQCPAPSDLSYVTIWGGVTHQKYLGLNLNLRLNFGGHTPTVNLLSPPMGTKCTICQAICTSNGENMKDAQERAVCITFSIYSNCSTSVAIILNTLKYILTLTNH